MSTQSATAGQVTRTAADIYDEFFVPALFGQWAAPLCEAAGIGAGDSVLDVACGTGATTREAAQRAGGGAHVTGIDRNAGMLAVARRRAPDVRWIEALAEHMPLEDAVFDAVLCQFALMFFDDRIRALHEMERVLRPGGRLAMSVWDKSRNSPGYARMIELIDEMFGTDAADALRAPFVLGDADKVRDLLAEAGLNGATIEATEGMARFESIREWVRMDVRGWTLAEFIDDAGYEALVKRAEREMARFAGRDGRVAFVAPAHLVRWTKG